MAGKHRRSTPWTTYLRQTVVSLLVVMGGLTLSVGSGTTAMMTDAASADTAPLRMGTVDLNVTPSVASFAMTSMNPGDRKVGTMTVTNAGTLPHRYSARATAGNADGKGLASALLTTVKVGVQSCTAASFSSSGTVVYSGVLGSPSGVNWIGSPNPGPQIGDLTLAPGASETFCVLVEFPSGAAASLQGAVTNATITFSAEQTANNQ